MSIPLNPDHSADVNIVNIVRVSASFKQDHTESEIGAFTAT